MRESSIAVHVLSAAILSSFMLHSAAVAVTYNKHVTSVMYTMLQRKGTDSPPDADAWLVAKAPAEEEARDIRILTLS